MRSTRKKTRTDQDRADGRCLPRPAIGERMGIRLRHHDPSDEVAAALEHLSAKPASAGAAMPTPAGGAEVMVIT